MFYRMKTLIASLVALELVASSAGAFAFVDAFASVHFAVFTPLLVGWLNCNCLVVSWMI